MLKLNKDKKKMFNIKMGKITKYKCIAASSFGIFITLLGYPYLNINAKKINVDSTNYDQYISKNVVPLEFTYTKEDIVINECMEKVSEYAPIFNLNEQVVFNIAKENIENYGVAFVIEKDYDCIDTEIILLCKDIINNPSLYGIDNNIDLYTDKEYTPTLTIREMVDKYSDLFKIDNTMALTISCAESGDYTKPIATSRNNPFARRSQEFFIYDNLEEGIIEGIYGLRNGYIEKGLTTYESMEPYYCAGSNGHWTSLMYGKQYQIENGLTLYDEENKTLTMTN